MTRKKIIYNEHLSEILFLKHGTELVKDMPYELGEIRGKSKDGSIKIIIGVLCLEGKYVGDVCIEIVERDPPT